jgi:hypothetical protein
VFDGNTGDPSTLAAQVTKLKERFGLSRVVLVGDRGMITEARIGEDLAPAATEVLRNRRDYARIRAALPQIAERRLRRRLLDGGPRPHRRPGLASDHGGRSRRVRVSRQARAPSSMIPKNGKRFCKILMLSRRDATRRERSALGFFHLCQSRFRRQPAFLAREAHR